MTIPAVPNDISLSKSVKCISGCQRCKCSTNNLPCTPFSGCSIDQCTNRTSIPDDGEDDDDDEDALEFIYENESDTSDYSNNDEIQPIVMDMSIYMEHSYCCRLTSCSPNNYNSTTENITSSPLQSSNVSSPFDNSLSPIVPSAN
ncbi:unnamed protein product, partial [Rotaria sp. Silwood2]